jgi:hypothetical protein
MPKAAVKAPPPFSFFSYTRSIVLAVDPHLFAGLRHPLLNCDRISAVAGISAVGNLLRADDSRHR